MFKKLFNIPIYLNLKEVGLLEFVFSITPMLTGFSLWGLPMGLLMWVVLVVLVMMQGNVHMGKFKPMAIFVAYWAIHDLLIMFVDNVNINGEIQQAIYFLSFFLLFPRLNFEKLKGSLNWIALIAMGGLLYQWGFVAAGEGVHPLQIPGLTMSEGRLEQLSLRPSSFFMEPASYVAFMVCPLAMALLEKKYPWAIALILSIFLTTSTTGLVGAFIMLVMSVFGKRMRVTSIMGVFIVGFGLFYALTNLEVFEVGVAKVENTDVNSNVRLSQGPYVVSTMESAEYVFGAPYISAYNYCVSRGVMNVSFYGESVYLSTLWIMILCYGVVGLLLYLNIFFNIAKKSRVTWPLIAFLLATIISSSYRFSTVFIFIMVVLMVVIKNEQMEKQYAKHNSISH